jgi:hypothetical protein
MAVDGERNFLMGSDEHRKTLYEKAGAVATRRAKVKKS